MTDNSDPTTSTADREDDRLEPIQPLGARIRVVAYVPDLMDRSRLSTLGDVDLVHVQSPHELAAVTAAKPTDLVIVDVARSGVLEELRVGLKARVVGFASHVDKELIADAHAAGCTEVLARSRFFKHLPELVGG